jgi:hypothetical protein
VHFNLIRKLSKMNKKFDLWHWNRYDTACLSLRYRVISIDASPELVKAGLQRFQSQIQKNQVEILNGIAESEVDFYLKKLCLEFFL